MVICFKKITVKSISSGETLSKRQADTSLLNILEEFLIGHRTSGSD